MQPTEMSAEGNVTRRLIPRPWRPWAVGEMQTISRPTVEYLQGPGVADYSQFIVIDVRCRRRIEQGSTCFGEVPIGVVPYRVTRGKAAYQIASFVQ